MTNHTDTPAIPSATPNALSAVGLFDPATIWSLATADRQIFGNTTINIILQSQRTRAPGDYCLIIRNGRLYSKHSSADTFITRISPNGIETRSGELGPVFAYNWNRCGDCVLLGASYRDFIEKITRTKEE